MNKAKLKCQWEGLQPTLFHVLQTTHLHLKNSLPETLPAALVLSPKGDGSNGKKFRLSGREGKPYGTCRDFTGAGLRDIMFAAIFII